MGAITGMSAHSEQRKPELNVLVMRTKPQEYLLHKGCRISEGSKDYYRKLIVRPFL